DPHHVELSTATLPLHLEVGDLPTAGKYVGTLTMLASGFDPASWKLILTGVGVFRPATLVVDRGAITTSVTTCPLFHCLVSKPKATSVRLSDKNRLRPLDGITLRQEASAKVSEFDVDRNLAFTFNNNPVERFGALGSQTRV